VSPHGRVVDRIAEKQEVLLFDGPEEDTLPF
jgi:hypothetical protein